MPAVAEAGIVSGKCTPSVVKYVVSNSPATVIASNRFQNLPEAEPGFVQGTTMPGCALVTFPAAGFSPDGVVVKIRAVIDHSQIALPRDFKFMSDDPNHDRTRTATFIFPRVTSGAHVLRIQFASDATRHPEIGRHSIIAQFVP